MARKIRIPLGFREDFDFYCDRAGLDAAEREEMRDAVRADFKNVGGWIVEAAAVYRFCDRLWGGEPTLDQVREYVRSVGWSPADPTIFDRFGIMLLARVCASVAGVIPMPEEVQ